MRTFIRCHTHLLMVALLTWTTIPRAHAEDLTTLAGTTYHQVRVVRIEPDGIVWEHATGVCKVDFTDLPETVRRKYHYDAKQADTYQAAQTRAKQQAAERLQQDQQLAAAWQARQLQQSAAAASSDAPSGTFVYRRRVADVRVEQSVGEQIKIKQSEQSLLTKDDGTIWDRRIWAAPCLLAGRGYHPGVAFDPHTERNAQEYQASLHRSGSDFFNPIYMTKSYDEDVDRAKAFERGQP